MTVSTKQCRLFGIVFFISLALNLFLAGWMFGGDMFHRPPPPHGGGRGMFFERFEEKVAALPPESRGEVQAVLKRYQPKLRKQMKGIMQTRDAIDAMYKRPDYSRGEAEERFDQLQQQSLTMQELAQEMMLELADVLPPEQRATFMERPKEWRGKGDAYRDKPKGPPPPR